MRTKDIGITRAAILGAMSSGKVYIRDTIPEFEEFIRRGHLRKDVSVRTAVKNMLKDGIIKVVDKPRHCYQATQYRLVQICAACGYPETCRAIYSDAECTKLDYLICDQCYDMMSERWL